MYFQEDSHVQEPFQVKTGPMSYILLREEVTQYTHMSKIIIYNVYFMYLTEKRERENKPTMYLELEEGESGEAAWKRGSLS